MTLPLTVLVGCEESGTVRDAFRERGHYAWSCDLVESRGKFTVNHIKLDIVTLLAVYPDEWWDLVILFPDCTHMATSGNKWWSGTTERADAIEWTTQLWNLAKQKSKRVALENPSSVIWPVLRPLADTIQFIQPHQFGHRVKKKTGLALHNLPRLRPTAPLSRSQVAAIPRQDLQAINNLPNSSTRKRDRSKTFQGVAEAMSEQWTLENISRITNGFPQRA